MQIAVCGSMFCQRDAWLQSSAWEKMIYSNPAT